MCKYLCGTLALIKVYSLKWYSEPYDSAIFSFSRNLHIDFQSLWANW